MEHALKPRWRDRGFLCISKGDRPVTRGSLQKKSKPVVVEMKARQAAKIRAVLLTSVMTAVAKPAVDPKILHRSITPYPTCSAVT
jgi:hypothetical protein